jgi:hypothetical protein
MTCSFATFTSDVGEHECPQHIINLHAIARLRRDGLPDLRTKSGRALFGAERAFNDKMVAEWIAAKE